MPQHALKTAVNQNPQRRTNKDIINKMWLTSTHSDAADWEEVEEDGDHTLSDQCHEYDDAADWPEEDDEYMEG